MNTDYVSAIKSLFYVSGEIDECEPELVYKFFLKNPQRKDNKGSHRATYERAFETLNGNTFKVHSLQFNEDTLLYEAVLVNDDISRRDEVNRCVMTVYEEVESLDLNTKEKTLKPLFTIYSKRDCYKVLDHIYNMRTGVKDIQDPNFVTKHKVIIGYRDITISNTFEVKGKIK